MNDGILANNGDFMSSVAKKHGFSKNFIWLLLFVYLVTIIFWLSFFKVKESFDINDVFFEGIYLFVALVCLIFIKRLNLLMLHVGWGLFAWGLIIDFLDEFTSEPDLYDTFIEGIIVSLGLSTIAYAFYVYYFQQKRMENKLESLANHDPITASYNRNYLNMMIKKEEDRSRRYNHDIGFMMVDIDRFKELNDRFGHHVGDKILKYVAHFLTTQLRSVDEVIRYGGDEFLIVFPESKEDLNQIKKRLVDNFSIKGKQEFEIEFSLSLSIGYALWKPDKKESVANIIDLADKRMYQEKAKKKEQS